MSGISGHGAGGFASHKVTMKTFKKVDVYQPCNMTDKACFEWKRCRYLVKRLSHDIYLVGDREVRVEVVVQGSGGVPMGGMGIAIAHSKTHKLLFCMIRPLLC